MIAVAVWIYYSSAILIIGAEVSDHIVAERKLDATHFSSNLANIY